MQSRVPMVHNLLMHQQQNITGDPNALFTRHSTLFEPESAVGLQGPSSERAHGTGVSVPREVPSMKGPSTIAPFLARCQDTHQ